MESLGIINFLFLFICNDIINKSSKKEMQTNVQKLISKYNKLSNEEKEEFIENFFDLLEIESMNPGKCFCCEQFVFNRRRCEKYGDPIPITYCCSSCYLYCELCHIYYNKNYCFSHILC